MLRSPVRPGVMLGERGGGGGGEFVQVVFRKPSDGRLLYRFFRKQQGMVFCRAPYLVVDTIRAELQEDESGSPIAGRPGTLFLPSPPALWASYGDPGDVFVPTLTSPPT